MSFWSGETLGKRLPVLIKPYKSGNIDCASYRLCVGDQSFVTSEALHSDSPHASIITVLSDSPPDNVLAISPGQFAFIMTDEVVEVPEDAIALISFRAKYKFKGLVNVSGFHVDPGWKGKLIYSVYNAGPQVVYLSRGEPVFIIVYADLDCSSEVIYGGGAKDQKDISISLVENMRSQAFSPQIMRKKLDVVAEQMTRIEMRAGVFAGVAAALAVATGVMLAALTFFPSWSGVMLARTLDAAGYEVKQKTEGSDDKDEKKAVGATISISIESSAPVVMKNETVNLKDK